MSPSLARFLIYGSCCARSVSPSTPRAHGPLRVLFYYFARFLTEYESRFEKEYGFFRPIIKEVVERYFDCGNPRCGFARIRCPDCHADYLLMFSCRTRRFCPSCHLKRLEQWGEWMREELLLDVPHRQVVFTIPQMLRIFFKYKRRLLGELCRCALRSLIRYFEVLAGSELRPGVIAAIQTFGDRINAHPHLCGGTMKVISFLIDFSVVGRIIDHLKLILVAERPPPPHQV